MNQERIKWACRRGMLELDLFLVPFFEHQYCTLSDNEKLRFQTLLEQSDPQLLSYLMDHDAPEDQSLKQLIEKIRAFRITRSQTEFF